MARRVKPSPRATVRPAPATNRVNKYDGPDRNKRIRRPSILVTLSPADPDCGMGRYEEEE